jgi:hypothetical protein
MYWLFDRGIITDESFSSILQCSEAITEAGQYCMWVGV